MISSIIFENLSRGTFSFFEFYRRRIARIFPALMVVLAACLLVGWFILLPDEYQQLGKQAACLRTVGERNPDLEIAKLEQELMKLGNSIGKGDERLVPQSGPTGSKVREATPDIADTILVVVD